MRGNQLVLQASLERFGDDFRCRSSCRLRVTPRRGEVPRRFSAIMTDLHVRFLRVVANRIQRELDEYDPVERPEDAASRSRRERLRWLVTRARERVAEAEARRRYLQPNRVS
jgi:hypothetical protein